MLSHDIKHVFLVSSAEVFSPLYLDALLYKANILPESICVVYFHSNASFVKEPKRIGHVNYVNFSEVDRSIFINAKTITYFSLSPLNSSHVKEVLEIDSNIKNKCYMFITDDEVERWLKCIDKYGCIKPDAKLLISDNDVWVLDRQQCFIALDTTFRNKLKRVLERSDIKIVDAGVIFDTLPTLCSKKLESAINLESIHKVKRIMLGSKPNAFNYKEIKSFLSEFVSRGIHKQYKFIVMWPSQQWRKRVILELYLFYLRKFKKEVVDLSVITSLSPLSYTTLVMSNTHLVLQPRGGASTARQFMKWGQGVVCVASDSHNDQFFCESQSVDLIRYRTYSQLIDQLERDVDIVSNANKIKAEEKRSLDMLIELYS
ncbi:hypothetical protein [Vibrio alfacsensis]|uniref:hypothetical protein n=1 Tax=Vibrio TaxID=662 RepID=UPI0040679839